MRTFVACLLFLCSAATCQTGHEVTPTPDPEPQPDPSPMVVSCLAASATVERLGCPDEWGINEKDGTFFDLCIRAETEGPRICPDAIAAATTCDEADAISQECAE